MRILYLTNETPLFPAGGIGTYIGYAAKAMIEAGHEAFLFTWGYDLHLTQDLKYEPFRPENTRIMQIEGWRVWKQYPNGPYNHALSSYILTELSTCVKEWAIDVVEATDYLSPALALFQDLQASLRDRDVLCVTYNHGFVEDFYDADQIAPKQDVQSDLVGERQQCRISDLIITPSVSAMRRLAAFGIVDNVCLVREPYAFDCLAPVQQVRRSFTYMGRISISKGIDKLILLANLTHEQFPLEQILLVGKLVATPFRIYNIEEYIRTRLRPELRDIVLFVGGLKRSVALNLITPGALAPSLGSAETFSYACVEMIDRGLVPVVRHGTPMAEFFPAELQEYILDERLADSKKTQRQMDRIVADARNIVATVQQFNIEALHPAAVARQMADLYEAGLRAKRSFRSLVVRSPATVEDVTVIIPAFRPDEVFLETIDSICCQSAGIPKVLVCNDGTPDSDCDWFDYALLRLPECRIVAQPNGGLLSARNTLINEVDTKLAIFLDTDDILHAKFLERTLEAYNSAALPANAVLTFRQNFFESDEAVIRNLMDDHLHFVRNDFRMTALIETDVLREIGFDSTRRNGEGDDWIFWLRFTAAGYRSVVVPQLLFRYRFRTGSMSWPWSMGQVAGTSAMVREAAVELADRRPKEAARVVRALHAVTTVVN